MAGLMIVMMVCAVLLSVLGLFIKNGKGFMLIAGYNTMPKEEQDKVDKAVLAKTISNLLLRTALSLGLAGVAAYLKITWAMVAFFVIPLVDVCISLVILNRRILNTKAPDSKGGASKGVGVVSIVITAIAIIAVSIMFYYGEKEPVVRCSHGNIQIEALYGLDIDVSEVKALSLIEQSMEDVGIGQRDNGYGGVGQTLKGHFSSVSRGGVLLFVESESSPTLWIERDGAEDVYISFVDGEKTRTLYQTLAAEVPRP